MKTDFKRPFVGLLALAAILGPAPSLANPTEYSEKSAAVVPDNAQAATCNKYTVGGTQLRARNPGSGGTVSGGGQTATYSLPDGKTLSFSDASIPIDFVIVRGKQGSEKSLAIHYYASGVNDDSNIKVLGADETPLPVVEFALCANAADTLGTPPIGGPVCGDPILECSGNIANACPFDTTPDAQSGPYQFALVRITPFAGTDGEILLHETQPSACYCSNDPNLTGALPCCDGTLPKDAMVAEGQPGPCRPLSLKVKELTDYDNDPKVCVTVLGTTTCYRVPKG